MADKSERGRFVWHDLMTPNIAGAQAFYSQAIGWKTQSWEQDPSYSMFVAPSGPLGGLDEWRDGSPHWRLYIATPDIDATVQQATRLGGGVITAPTPLPNGGKFAVLTDPQGATFGIYWSSAGSGPEATPKHGEFSWHELATTDHRAAWNFYSALFGWDKLNEFDMGPQGIYLIFGRNGAQLGGMFDKGEMGRPGPGYWVGYVRVKDVHETAKKVKAARGSLVHGPAEVPGGDWIAQFMDPHGALFAAHTLAVDVKAAKKPDAAKKETAKTAAAAPKKAAKKPTGGKKATKKKAAPKKKRAAAKKPKRPVRKAAKTSRRKAATKSGKKKRAAGKKKAASKVRKRK